MTSERYFSELAAQLSRLPAQELSKIRSHQIHSALC